MPVFLGYDQTERMIAALLDRAAQWQPEAVVGIARGGLVPGDDGRRHPGAAVGDDRLRARQRSHALDRRAGERRPDPAGRRRLQHRPHDGSGAVGAAAEGRDCLTLAVVHDPEVTRYVPDLSHAMRALWRFPGSAARRRRPAARCAPPAPDRIGRPNCRSTAWTSTACSCPTCRMRCTSADIAEAVLRRHGLDPFPTLPFFSPERAVVITGRPDADRERTQAWLARWGHGALPLECRPPTCRTRRTRSRATRPRRRRAGAARISSRATPSRRCASRRMRRTWW